MNVSVIQNAVKVFLNKAAPWFPVLAFGAALFLQPKALADAMAATDTSKPRFMIGRKLGEQKAGQLFKTAKNGPTYQVIGLNPLFEEGLKSLTKKKYFVLCHNQYGEAQLFPAKTIVRRVRSWD